MVHGVSDTQCGFKILSGDLARDVFAACSTNGFSFDVELLARCQALGSRIEEIAVNWVDVPGSTFSPLRHGLRSFAELVAINWRVRTHPTRRSATVTPLRVDQPQAATNTPLRLAGSA